MIDSLSDMPVVILAGGRGARFDHESQVTPKPLIPVAGRPIIWHIIDGLMVQGFRRFYVAGGYLCHQFYDGPYEFDSDLQWHYHGERFGGWDYSGPDGASILVVNTGERSGTGERVWRLREHIGQQRFVLTYGDGLSDVQMSDVLAEHTRDWRMDSAEDWHPAFSSPLVTLTAVNPPGRFGTLHFNGAYHHHVRSFHEKGAVEWINGGFMVCEPEIFPHFWDDGEPGIREAGFFSLEEGVLPYLASKWLLRAHRHSGYWRCMDTRRDLETIEADVERANGLLPWRRDMMWP